MEHIASMISGLIFAFVFMPLGFYFLKNSKYIANRLNQDSFLLRVIGFFIGKSSNASRIYFTGILFILLSIASAIHFIMELMIFISSAPVP